MAIIKKPIAVRKSNKIMSPILDLYLEINVLSGVHSPAHLL